MIRPSSYATTDHRRRHQFTLPTPPDNVRIEESRRGKFLLAWNPVDIEHVTNYIFNSAVRMKPTGPEFDLI